MVRVTNHGEDYELIDSGNGWKLERFGRYVLSRPCSQAIWPPRAQAAVWQAAHASFERRPGKGWQVRVPMEETWQVTMEGLIFRLKRTDFGHVGVFPEQRRLWRWIVRRLGSLPEPSKREIQVLNLFAYSGGATLACAASGVRVCHLDASRGMVAWARENARLNGLEHAPVRWIVDDANKFLDRELRRSRRYDAVILDPPTYGHGANDEIFKIEDDLQALMRRCWSLLSERPLFVLLSSHTPGCTPKALENVMVSTMQRTSGSFESGEMLLEGGPGVLAVPSGSYCRWVPGPGQGGP